MNDHAVLDEGEITQLLKAQRAGQDGAFDRLVELAYPHLYRIAQRQLSRQSKEATLDATALVNESYLQLVDETGVEWKDRGHFYAIAALTMRRILVDQARRRMSAKRGAGQVATTLNPSRISFRTDAELILAVDQAVDELEEFNPRLARVVECRYFAGLDNNETASALDVSSRTVERDWLRARAWLAEKLG